MASEKVSELLLDIMRVEAIEMNVLQRMQLQQLSVPQIRVSLSR